jgi:hypothetical protein
VETAGCQGFEIAVEKRLHGALAEPERAALDEHLAGCERCPAYQAAARGAEAGMRAEASAAVAELAWERVERGIRRSVRAWPRWLAGAVLAGAWVALVAWLSAPPELRSGRMLRALPAVAIVVVLVALVAGYSARRLAARVDQGEMLATYRQVVAANLQWARRMKWALAALLAFFLYRAMAGKPATYDPLVYFGGLSLPLAGLWGYLRHVTVPRAEREARDLGFLEGAGF